MSRLLSADAADGSGGDLPAGAGQGASDQVVAAEAAEGHGVDQMPRHVGVATDGRDGLDQGADGVRREAGFGFGFGAGGGGGQSRGGWRSWT